MKTSEALKLVGGLSKPSKMPGWAYGLPDNDGKTGTKLVSMEIYMEYLLVLKIFLIL